MIVARDVAKEPRRLRVDAANRIDVEQAEPLARDAKLTAVEVAQHERCAGRVVLQIVKEIEQLRVER